MFVVLLTLSHYDSDAGVECFYHVAHGPFDEVYEADAYCSAIVQADRKACEKRIEFSTVVRLRTPVQSMSGPLG